MPLIPLLLSATFGAGIYLLYEAFTAPRTTEPARRWPRMEEFLLHAGLAGVTPRAFVLFALGSGALCGLLTQLILGWVVVSALAFGLGLGAPIVYYLDRADRRHAATQAALVDASGQLRDAIRSGLSVAEAFGGLARHGPEALQAEFRVTVREMHLIGFPAALTALRDRLADPVSDLLVASLLLNDRLGGRNLSQMLDRLVVATRAQVRVQDELRAYQAKNVSTARVVAAVPVVLLLAMRGVDPSYFAIFNTFLGQLVIAFSVASIVVGYAAMLWIARLPDEPRVLR